MPGNHIKVLVIDDNQVVLDVTAAGLEAEGFTVDTALDGNTGLAKSSEMKPDLVLLDVKLPDIDGFQVCKELRSRPATQATPVIMMTGDRTVDIDKGFAVGADDCIIKPIDLAYLSARIIKLVKKKQKILLVDDDRQICDMLADVLGKQDFDVEVHYDGRNILDVVRKAHPDIIFLDVSLPVGPDGLEMCMQIKNNPETKHIPVIMLTANESVDSVEKCFNFGAEDYIFKPFKIPDLLLKLRKYLKNAVR